MNAFIEGDFHLATIFVIVVVSIFSVFPVIPLLIKKLYRPARRYYLLMAVPISIGLTAPMLAIIFDEGFAQVGWVF